MSHSHHIGPPPFKLSPDVLAALRHQAIVYRKNHDDLLPPTKDWHYLESRWLLNPSRFDAWHPKIGRWITENYHLTHEPVIPVAPPYECHVVVPPGPVLPLAPSAVPEPSSSILVCSGLFILVLVMHVVGRRTRA